MGRGKRSARPLSPAGASTGAPTLARDQRQLPLSDSSSGRRRLPPEGVANLSFAAFTPPDAIREQAKLIAVKVRQGHGWDEAADVLWRYRDHLEMTPERPYVPPALDTVWRAVLEAATDDGKEHLEGYARRYFVLLGAEPRKTPLAAYGLKGEGRVHLVDLDDPTRSACGALNRVTTRQHAVRGHFGAAREAHLTSNGRASVGGRRACLSCLHHHKDHPAYEEDGFFSVLREDKSGRGFPPLARTAGGELSEGARLVGFVREEVIAWAKTSESPSGDELRLAARGGMAAGLSDLAADRLGELEWEPLRRHWFGADLRLGAFYRAAYGKAGREGPSADEWRRALGAAWPHDVLVVSDEETPMLFDPDEHRRLFRGLADDVVAGLLAYSFPEMMELIERELEGPKTILHGTTDDFYVRLADRLDSVWRRADRLKRRATRS